MYKKSVNRQETSLLSQYREFFEPASDGVFFADSAGNIIEANSHGCKMFGYSHEEICNLSIKTLISPENIHEDPIQFEILSEDQTTIKERKLRRKDGSLFDAEIQGRRLPNNIILGIIRDITEHKETQKQLHLAETRFQKFVEMANGIVFSIDQNQRITYVNPQIKSMLGYDVEETIGKYANEFIFSEAIEDHEIHVKKAEAHQAELYEQQLLKKDGTVIWGLVSSTPEFDQDGQFLGAFGTIMNITHQKQQEYIQETRIHLMQFARTSTLDTLLQETLDKICVLTNSSIGFYHFLEPDQKTISLQTWSTDTKKYFCQAKGKKLHYDIDEAGVWVDCIRQRKPVIHNDYSALEKKRGLPPGHALVVRELVVPVFRDDSIVAVLGVGNKPAEYDQNDIDLISSFTDLAWDIAERKRNEIKYQMVADFTYDWETWIAPNGTYTYCSPSCERITGYPPEKFINHPDFLLSITHPEDYESVKHHFSILDADFQQDEKLVFRIINQSGQERWIEHICVALFTDDGTYLGRRGSNRDVTDKKIIENILIKNEKLLEKSQKMAHLGSYEIDIVQKSVVWSKETFRIFGLAENDSAPTVEEYQAFVHPEDVTELNELVDDCLRTGKDFKLTYRIIRGNGEISTVFSLGKITRDKTGQITGMTGTIQDITENQRIQTNLDEVNQRYQRLANNAPDIIFRYVLSPTMQLEYINPAVETITGYSPEECYADSNLMLTMAHPDDAGKLASYLQSLTPPAEPLILRWIGKDGVTRWMESRIVIVKNDKGQITAVEGITRDISERKMAEDLLLESEQRFRHMADNAPVLIWMSGKDKLCTYFNQTWLNFTGRTLQQELGEGWSEGVHPDDFSTCLETYSTAFDLHQSFEMDYRLRSANGDYRWIVDQGIPRFSPEGEFLGYIGTGYDITERKQSEDALKRSETLLKETQQLTHLGGWEYQVSTGKMTWSDEVYNIHDLSREQSPVDSQDLIQLGLECYPSEVRNQIKNAFDECVQNGIPYELELPFITFQGKNIWVRTIGKPVITDGKIIRVVGNIMDITERKLAQIKLQASLDEKDVLIREVHHRVKNNLAAILGLLELERQTTSDPAATILLNELGNRIKSMSTVHEKLYRSENLSKIDFHDYLTSFVSHLRTSLNIKNNVVSLLDAEGIELSLEYAIPCGLIVNELVTNALKHAFPNNKPGVPDEEICKIIVSMEEKDATYTLTVADNGVGLSKDIQWESSTSLGLRLFRMLGEHQLGGKTTLDRTKGTQFSLVFKLREKGLNHD